MVTCYIGIGSNLGKRQAHIQKAQEELEKNSRIRLKRTSSIYETEPEGYTSQRRFMNGVLEVETDLDAQELLEELNGIEKRLGRKRLIKNGPRTIDLDILYFGDEIINEDNLVVPHPGIMQREFVLKGLRELGKA